MNVISKLIPLLSLISLAACSSVDTPKDTDSSIVVIDKPVIRSFHQASDNLKKLKHSLVRIKVKQGEQESISTGFFYKTPDVLVTALHSFDKDHPCRTKNQCQIILGLVQDNTTLQEHELDAEVLLQEPDKDLIYLKVAKAAELMKIVPLVDSEDPQSKDTLAVGGFYQDNADLTFTMGKNISDKNNKNLTSIIVSKGFSGSPILDKKGQLIGVVSTYRPIKNQPIGLAQFVSINAVE
jgi:S1-C subfamily serine protease